MKYFLKIIRLPLDLVLVTIDTIRAIPDLILRRSDRPCRFCGRLEYLMDDQRPCDAANKYGNLWAFQAVCKCVKPADDIFSSGPYCDRFEPYDRPVKHLPLTILALVAIWGGIGFVAERYGHVSTHVASIRQSIGNAESKRLEKAQRQEPDKREKEQAAGRVTEAAALLADKQAKEAEALLKEAEDLDPSAPGLALQQMRLSREQANFADAERYALQARKQGESLAAIDVVLAEVHLRRGEEDEARASLDRVRSHEDRDADDLQMACAIYGLLGDIDNAKACLEEALTLDPEHLLSRLSEVSLLRSSGAVAEARAKLDVLLETYTNDVRVLMQEAEFLNQKGETEVAIARQRALMDRFPEYGPLAVRLANQYLRTRRPGEAKRMAERCTEYADANTRFAGHVLRAQLQQQKQLYTDARESIERALLIDPTNLEALSLNAHIRFGQKDYNAAIRILESLQDVQKHNAARSILLGRAYQRAGKEDKAIELLGRMMREHPDDQTPVIDLGNLHYEANRYEQAREIYEAFLERHPENAFVQNNYIITLAESKQDLDRAVALARPLRAAEPNNPIYADALGWSLTRSGVFAEAEAHLRFGVRGMPRHPEPRYHLATALEQLDKRREAISQLELAFSLAPTFKGIEEARKLLKRLKEQP